MFVMLLGSVVQAQGVQLQAQVPFEFKVGEMALPAGEYELTKLNIGGGTFRIRGEDAATLKVVMPVYSAEVKEDCVLVFNKYRENGGETSYFLSQIWVAGSTVGYTVAKSNAERAAAKRAARRDVITLVVQRANPRAE